MINKYKAPELTCPNCSKEMKIINQDNTINTETIKLEYGCEKCSNKGIVLLKESASYDAFIKNDKGETIMFFSDEVEKG